MTIIRTLALTSATVAFVSCAATGGDENYDTAGGYDTSNPYGVPSDGGYETAPYQQVNPPADNPTYGAAAYEDTAVAPPMAADPVAPVATAGTHTIVKGDTLWGLSRQYNVSVDAIRRANNMAPSDNTVRLGQTINIPAN